MAPFNPLPASPPKTRAPLHYEQAVTTAHAAFLTLQKQGKTLACAESYTGGLVAALLTEIPGSSQVFYGGVCSYSTQSKIEVLGIDSQLIADYGVVSTQVALAMAQAARKLFRADFGIATTGIAGPEGATATQAVGSVCWAFSGEIAGVDRDQVFSQVLTGNRLQIRLTTAWQIFNFLQGL